MFSMNFRILIRSDPVVTDITRHINAGTTKSVRTIVCEF